MRVSSPARLVIATSLIAVVAVAGPGAADRAQAAAPVTPAVSTSGTVPDGNLLGVAATSPDNAWAVGELFPSGNGLYRPLLLHWNGRAWSRLTVPGVTHGQLLGVTAVSAADVWVVGADEDGGPGLLILHWNGRTWSRVSNAAVSNPSYQGVAVAATADEVWVAAYNGRVSELLHMTGGRWYVVPTSLPLFYQVTCVSVVSLKLAWLSGVFQTTPGDNQSFLLRWNGSVWKRVADPMAEMATQGMVSGGPGGAVWAYGGESIGLNPLSMRWDGTRWHPVNSQGIDVIWGVAFIPGGTAWAVGWGLTGGEELIAHWTGSTWKQVAVPAIADGELSAVAAASARNGWAVGQSSAGSLILQWNGTTWS